MPVEFTQTARPQVSTDNLKDAEMMREIDRSSNHDLLEYQEFPSDNTDVKW